MKWLNLFSLLMISLLSYSQNESVIGVDTSQNDGDVFVLVDRQPQFKGGDKKLIEFYERNSKFSITKNRKEGQTVYFQFIVNKDGSVSGLEILKCPSEVLEEEIKRLVQIMPSWKPGKKNDEIVRVRVTQELIFRR